MALGPGALLLPGFAREREADLLAAVARVAAAAPFRHMRIPRGFTMSVAMTSCGEWGWVSDTRGYRYADRDPATGHAWPAMPDVFLELARDAAATAGYPGFAPDSCLVNRYAPGARMSLHQDRDEVDRDAPIVSVSLGAPATFLWGGPARGDKALRVPLTGGDVVVWGGPSRLWFHGVAPLRQGERINLTFRKAMS